MSKSEPESSPQSGLPMGGVETRSPFVHVKPPERKVPWRATRFLLPLLLVPIAMVLLQLWQNEIRDLGPVPPPTGTRIAQPVDLVLVIDDSGSNGMSDPESARWEAARRTVKILEDHPTQVGVDRVGVVRFGSEAVTLLPLTDVSDAAVDRALVTPDELLGATNHPAAIQAADAQFDDDDERRHVTILLTDGAPSFALPSGVEDPFETIRGAFDLLPGWHTHVVGLNADGGFAALEDRWVSMGVRSVTRIETVRGHRAEWALARPVVEELGMHLPER